MRILFSACSLVLLLLCNPAVAQKYISILDPPQYTISQPYDYPPKTGYWWKSQSHADRIKELQVPQDILEQITTEALVQTAIDYPFLIDLLCFDSLQQGFESVCRNSNVFAEVLKRPDAGIVLLQIYEQTPVCTSEDGSFLDFYTSDVLEMFLLQDSVIKQLRTSELDALTQFINEKYAIQREYPRIYTPNEGGAYELLQDTSRKSRKLRRIRKNLTIYAEDSTQSCSPTSSVVSD